MSLHRLESLDDPCLDPYRALKETRALARRGRFIAEGLWLVQRLLASNYATESVLLEQRRLDDVREHCPPETPIYVLPDGDARHVVGFNFHRGVLACGARPASRSAPELIATLAPGPSIIVALAGVQDPQNLGGALRNAAAFGAAAVLLGPGCADPLSRRVLRVSMGTALRVPWFCSNDLPRDLCLLRTQAGFAVLATTLDDGAVPLHDGAVPLHGYAPPSRVVLVLGEEAHGLAEDVLGASDHRLTIPMAEGVDSLNVATASGVFLYCLRQAIGGR